ncbi:MAG: ATP-binding protein [Flavobacteriia bacterium]|nr:ATP-binding protein [Flavobacteriia bacterium]OJX38510.1 MAG: ATPase [Flavobacteriia bacterium 40-80]
MIIQRIQEQAIKDKLVPNKVVLLIGARRVGKTELIKSIIESCGEKVLFFTGDDIETHNLLEKRSLENYNRLLGDCRFLVIDEAQEISDIGMKLKLMVDNIPGLKILVSGSSAFELNNQIGEPLVGRMYTFQLFPVAQMEFSAIENLKETYGKLEERLIYGSYPELLHLNNLQDKEIYLKELVHSYLLKDILTFEGIKKRDVIMSLLQKLAFRNGSEVSLEALGNELRISKNTVEKYLDLFKKVFIIYDVSGFSKNRDNEITKMKKWYFVDNGIRNTLISNFSPLNLRTDVGQLWENYLNSERNKLLHYKQMNVNSYFWRTHTQQEIDRIEEKNQKISAFEYKWADKKHKIPTQFAAAYPDAPFTVIDRDNYLDFIL